MWTEIFGRKKPLIGVIHLPALPGSPSYRGEPFERILERALRDLASLEEGGADAAILENFGDRPFAKFADKATVAQMAVIARELVRNAKIPIGVNVLRSDGVAALSIAFASGASFIRVNVFSGVVFTDQGLIEGCAREVLALRRALGAKVAILADVHVKHAFHFGDIADAARDAARNGKGFGSHHRLGLWLRSQGGFQHLVRCGRSARHGEASGASAGSRFPSFPVGAGWSRT